MSLINYTDIDFNKSINKETKKIDFNGYIIEVIPYLSINDKYDLIITTLNRSDEGDLYNNFKTKFYFDLHLVLMYSNIVFTEEDKRDELKLYDTLKQSGLMDAIISVIPESEKNSLWEDIIGIQKSMIEYRRSLNSFFNLIFEKVPETVDKIKELFANVDENTMKQAMQMLSNINNIKNIPQDNK